MLPSKGSGDPSSSGPIFLACLHVPNPSRYTLFPTILCYLTCLPNCRLFHDALSSTDPTVPLLVSPITSIWICIKKTLRLLEAEGPCVVLILPLALQGFGGCAITPNNPYRYSPECISASLSRPLLRSIVLLFSTSNRVLRFSDSLHRRDLFSVPVCYIFSYIFRLLYL